MDNKKNTADDMDVLSPEEIKAIGEIEIGPSKQDRFLNQHYKKLIVGAIAVMVAVSVGICIFTFHQKHKEAGAVALTEAVITPATGEAVSPASYSSTGLTAVQNEYSGTASAATARMLEGISLLSNESTAEQGLAILDEVASSAEDDLQRARAAAAIALHYTSHISPANREEGVKKAEEAWLRVTEMPVNAYTALAYVTLGDLAQSRGDVAAARSYYEQLSTVCPGSYLAQDDSTMGLRMRLLETDDPIRVQPQPVAPATPGAPILPDLPATPATPGAGSTPALPAVPETPGTPALPALPAVPETPGTPALPALPAVPETPAAPALPAVPETPAAPALPAAPETPAAPAAPALPAVPETPAAPALPAVPEPPAPEAPAVPAEAAQN